MARKGAHYESALDAWLADRDAAFVRVNDIRRAALGPDTDEAVLLLAHYDAHDVGEGALDNGCGCALVAEVGRLLATVEDDLDDVATGMGDS